jgi:hypothetical protein
MSSCEQPDKSLKKIAENYLDEKGYTILEELDEKIFYDEFSTERRKRVGKLFSDSVTPEPSEFARCAEIRLCYSILLEDQRAKFFLFKVTKMKRPTSKGIFSYLVVVDSLDQRIIGSSPGYGRKFFSEVTNYVRDGWDLNLKEKQLRK